MQLKKKKSKLVVPTFFFFFGFNFLVGFFFNFF